MGKKKSNRAEEMLRNQCDDYREREELEKLNQQTRERVLQIQRDLWQQEARAAHHRYRQERKCEATVKLVFWVVMALVGIVSLLVMGFTESIPWWIAVSVAFLMAVTSAFRAGGFWKEIKM